MFCDRPFIKMAYFCTKNGMKRVITWLFLLILATGLFAQRGVDHSLVAKQYMYSFTGAGNQQQLDRLSTNLYQIKGVTEVKVTYKWDSGIGMIFFSYVENTPKGEQPSDFNPAEVKRIISDLGLVPFEFREL